MKNNGSQINIIVVDAIMGSYKSTSAIELIKNKPQEKFIFVTEYIPEVERVLEAVGGIIQPEAKYGEGSKAKHLLELLESGKRIAITHKLFSMINVANYHLLNDYTMILDEVPNVIEPIKILTDDVKMLVNEHTILVDSDSKVNINDDNYNGEFRERLDKCNTMDVYLYSDQLIAEVNPDLFRALKQTMVLTYQFEGSYLFHYFLRHSIPHHIKRVISAGNVRPSRYIEMFADRRFKLGNPRGNIRNPFSKNWWNTSTRSQREAMGKQAYAFFRKGVADECAYTLFDGDDDKIDIRGSSTIIPCNARATNKYSDITRFVFMVDVNPNPMVENWLNESLKAKNITFDVNAWKLANLVQVVFRTCIRKVGNDDQRNSNGDWDILHLYIMSKNLRESFQNWLNNK